MTDLEGVDNMQEQGKVVTEQRGRVFWVTLNDPQRMNPLSSAMRKGLREAFDTFEESRELRVMVITGCGRAFCAGGDISEFDMDVREGREFLREILFLLNRIELCPKPVITAVNGVAMGGGMELALASDVAIASDQARFGGPEARIGLVPGFAIVRLAETVGRARAKEFMMTADHITADEAQRIGLINRVVPHSHLNEEVTKVAERIAENAPLAVEFIKSAVNRELYPGHLSYAIDGHSWLFATGDQKEGMSAFLEKRVPRFTGN